jgi:putative ABC transport system substrate-binding protein
MRATHLALAACTLAAACGWTGHAAPPRVILIEPQPPGLVDIHTLASRLEAGTGATVEVRQVSVLSPDAIRAASVQIVAARPALIVAPAADLVYGLREQTHAIPILFISISDPIDSSLVTDTQRPRGNVSGFSFHVPLGAKQLEILRQAFPSTRRVGVLGDRYAFSTSAFREMSQAAGGPLGIEIVRVHFQSLDQLATAVKHAAGGVDAWLVPEAGVTHRFSAEIVALLAESGLPAIYGNDHFVRMGGLMSYSQSFDDPSGPVLRMARSVLQGFPVGELPVGHPEAFRFAINTDTWRRTRPPPPQRLLLLATDFYPRDAAP